MSDKYQVLTLQVNVNGKIQEINATVKAFCEAGDHVTVDTDALKVTEPREMGDDYSWSTMEPKETE